MATLFGAKGGASNSDLYTFDPVTGVWMAVGPIGFAVTGMAFDPASGILYGSTSSQSPLHPKSLITISPVTGAGTFVGAFAFLTTTMADIAFKSDGTLYGVSASGGYLCSINKSTGVATAVGTGNPGGFGWGFDIDAANNGWVFPNGADSGETFDAITLATGSYLRDIGTIQNGDDFPFTGDSIAAASFDDSGVMWLLMNNFGSASGNGLATLAPDGTFTTSIGSGIQNGDALAWQGSVKPNPWIGNSAFNPNTLLAARASSYTTSDLYSVDPATGVMTSIGPIGYAVTGLAQDPITLTLYGITSNNSTLHPHSLITIDPVTGAGTFVAAENTRNPWTDIAFDAFGRLFAQGQSARFLLVNKATAVGVQVGAHSGGTFGGGLAIDTSNVGYSAFIGSSTSQSLYMVNLSTGVYTAVALFNGAGVGSSGWAMPAAGFDAADVLWAADGDQPGGPSILNLVTVDTATATVTIIAPFSLDGVDALCWAQTTTATDDFSVALTPNALTIFRGNNDTTALTTVVTAGVAQSVALSDTGAPAGVSLAYGANPIMSGGGTTVTVTVTGATVPGVYPIIVHAVGAEATHLATLTVTVPGPINDAYSVFQSHNLTVAAPGVTSNDIDPTTVTLNTGPTHGSVILNSDGSFTYTPDPGFLGTDTFTYDGNGGTATVTITVAVRDPRAVFDSGPAFAGAA